MARKIMLEVTQPVMNGNEVTVHAGELFEPDAKLPEGVTTKEVIVDADDKPAEKPAQDKPAAKGAAK